jgi:hypothetical protein
MCTGCGGKVKRGLREHLGDIEGDNSSADVLKV